MRGDPHVLRERNQKTSFEILRESHHFTRALLHFLATFHDTKSFPDYMVWLKFLIVARAWQSSRSLHDSSNAVFEFEKVSKAFVPVDLISHILLKKINIYSTISARFLWWYFRLTLHLVRNAVHKFCHEQWCQLKRTQSKTLCTSAFAGHVERMIYSRV